MYYKGSKAAVVVYDITVYVIFLFEITKKKINIVKETFKSAKEWIRELHENTSPDTVIALVGNKIDMEDNKQVPTHVIFFKENS